MNDLQKMTPLRIALINLVPITTVIVLVEIAISYGLLP